jgi:hypothetical protein
MLLGLPWMVLEARWEGIDQKVDIAGRVDILAADRHRGRGRDTAGPDFREPHPPEARFPRRPPLRLSKKSERALFWGSDERLERDQDALTERS